MFVDEQRLDADKAFGSSRVCRCIDFEDAGLLNLDAGQIENGQEADLPVGRFENRVALVQDEFSDQVLCERGLSRLAAQVDRAARRWRSGGNRCRNTASLKRRVRNQAERKELVVAECGTIAFEYVVTVVRIPESLGITECRDDAPSIGDSGEFRQWPPDCGLQAFAIAGVFIGRRFARASSLPFGREFAIGAGIERRLLVLSDNYGRARAQEADEQCRFTYFRKHFAHRYL
jgi:hypothetical protein